MSQEEIGRREIGPPFTSRSDRTIDIEVALGSPPPGSGLNNPDSLGLQLITGPVRPDPPTFLTRILNRPIPIWVAIAALVGGVTAGAVPALLREGLAERARSVAPGTIDVAWNSRNSGCSGAFDYSGPLVRARPGASRRMVFFLDVVAKQHPASQSSGLDPADLSDLHTKGLTAFVLASADCGSQEELAMYRAMAKSYLSGEISSSMGSVALAANGWAPTTLLFVVDCASPTPAATDFTQTPPGAASPITASLKETDQSLHNAPVSLEPFLARVLSGRLRECSQPTASG